jgi:hypothetical protein
MMLAYIGEGGSLPGLTQILISSRNTLTETLRKKILLAMWVSLSPDQLTPKINLSGVYFVISISKMNHI